jgi:DNA repair protein RadC
MSHANALFTLNAAGEPVPASSEDIIAAAREHLSRRLRRGTSLSSPQAVRDFLAVKLGGREFESFCCLFLDNRHRLIEFVELFRGTIDSAAVYPREVVKEALKRNAAALVLYHYVARHRMRVMCPGSFCARPRAATILEPALPQTGPHNGRERLGRRVCAER